MHIGQFDHKIIRGVFSLQRRGQAVFAQGKRGCFIIKLMQSYFLIIFIWVMILFSVFSFYFSKLIVNESTKNNDRILNQFTVMADGYILANLKDISVRLYENCQKESFLYRYMNQSLDNHVVDTLAIRKYLVEMLTLNPMIDSLALYYPQSDLLVTSYVIRYPRTEGMYLGGLLTNFREISQFDGSYRWVADGKYQVIPATGTTFIDASGAALPDTVNAIHFVRKVPLVDEPSKTGCVLFVTIREEYLYSMLQTAGIGEFDKLIIADASGVVASHTDKEMINRNVSELPYGQMLMDAACEAESHVYDDGDGNRMIVSACRSSSTGWVYASVAPIGGLTSMGRHIFQMVGLSVLLASAVATILSAFCARRLSRPLNSLTLACMRLTPHLLPEGLNEYQLITSTIDNLQTQVKKHRMIQEKSQSILRHEYIRDLFSGEDAPPQPVSEWLDSLGISFPHESHCAFIVKLRDAGFPQDETLQSRIAGCAVCLESAIMTNGSVGVAGVGDDAVLLLVNFDRIHMGISDIVDRITACEIGGTAPPVCVFNGDAVSQDAVRVSATQARLAAAYHFLFPELSSIRYADISSRERSREQIDRSLLRNLSAHLKTQDHSKAMTTVDNLVSALRDSNCGLDHARWALRMAAAMIEDAWGAAGTRPDETGGNIPDRLDSSEDVFKYKKMLLKALDAYFKSFEMRHSERNRVLVGRAKEYMQRNISDTQLSLNGVADHIGISASHFSRVFKRETGMSFLDYMTDYKLDYCRRLLISTDARIEQIAGMLGYSTPQYFANRFKIKYGCSPKEYRFHNRP